MYGVIAQQQQSRIQNHTPAAEPRCAPMPGNASPIGVKIRWWRKSTTTEYHSTAPTSALSTSDSAGGSTSSAPLSAPSSPEPYSLWRGRQWVSERRRGGRARSARAARRARRRVGAGAILHGCAQRRRWPGRMQKELGR